MLAAGSPGPPALAPGVEETLSTPWNRSAAFFPTSRYWWVAHPDGWGFASHVHIVHFNELNALAIEIRWNGRLIEPASGRSFPSRAELRGSAPGLELGEAKLLLESDVLMSVLEFQAASAGRLELRASSTLARERSGSGYAGSGSFHGIELDFAFAGAGEPEGSALVLRRELAAGGRFEARFAVAAAGARAQATAALREALGRADPVASERAATEAWFARQPLLDVPDDWIRTAFLHRLQLARKSIQDPRAGYLQHPSAAEGRWASKWYAAAITFGVGHQLAELRWLREPRWAWGHLQTFLDLQRGDGAFVGARTNLKLGEYTDFIAMGALDLFLATGERDRFVAAAPALARNVDYVLSRDCDGDFLPEPASHWESGMEWQPSYFAFGDYVPEREERLDRVDYACYLHANALAAARALELAGRPAEAGRYREIARRGALAVEGKMWDSAARFYFSLRSSDDRMAPDREIVGFYPPGFGITPDERLGYLGAVRDPLRWAARWPLPSVEMVSPAHAPARGWPPGKGGSASMWNGPTWPHALTFALRSLGRGERASAVAPGTTLELFASWSRAQFLTIGGIHQARFPFAGECYDNERGIWQSSERDYFHSAYLDVAVTEIAGLRPGEGEGVRFEPTIPQSRWDHWALVRVPYHGHDLALAWDAPGGADHYGDGLEGLVLWVDGVVAARRDDVGAIEARLESR